jgi:ATP-binding cassette subfamily F protein uup
LHLLRTFLSGANVLMLDEPTNDLDTETLTVLEDVLDGWPGSLIVVSHDRYFLERVCDDVWELTNGSVRHLPGGVDEYLAPAAEPVAPAPRPSGGDTRAARKEVTRIERELGKAQRRVEDIHARMAEASTDGEALVGLGKELAQAERDVADLEDRWLEAAEAAQ